MRYCYAQIIPETGYVLGISELSGEINSSEMISIPEPNYELINKRYTNGKFIGLKIFPPKIQIAINENITLIVKWVDTDGNMVNITDDVVKANCNGVIEDIVMVDGVGQFDFSVLEVGKYYLSVYSLYKCRDEVVINAN